MPGVEPTNGEVMEVTQAAEHCSDSSHVSVKQELDGATYGQCEQDHFSDTSSHVSVKQEPSGATDGQVQQPWGGAEDSMVTELPIKTDVDIEMNASDAHAQTPEDSMVADLPIKTDMDLELETTDAHAQESDPVPEQNDPENIVAQDYDGYGVDAELDLNQVEYIQGDMKVEKREPCDYAPENEYENSESAYFADGENSMDVGIKTEQYDDTGCYQDPKNPEFLIKTESVVKMEENFCDMLDPSGNGDDESDSDDSSCPSVLEEFSTFPERSPPPPKKKVVDPVQPTEPPESDSSSLEMSDSENDNAVLVTRKNVNQSEAMSENDDNNDVQVITAGQSRGCVDPQETVEHILRGKVQVMSVESVNEIKSRIPKTGRLIPLLTISEIYLGDGMKRYKISYERNKPLEAAHAKEHQAFILQCNNIVKQCRKVHDAEKLSEKSAAVFSGMILATPIQPTPLIPFQVMYVWKVHNAGSELYILKIEGLNYAIQPYRVCPRRHCALDGVSGHICTLPYDESQLLKSELSAPTKQVLLQLVKNKWQRIEKCELKIYCPPQRKERKKTDWKTRLDLVSKIRASDKAYAENSDDSGADNGTGGQVSNLKDVLSKRAKGGRPSLTTTRILTGEHHGKPKGKNSIDDMTGRVLSNVATYHQVDKQFVKNQLEFDTSDPVPDESIPIQHIPKPIRHKSNPTPRQRRRKQQLGSNAATSQNVPRAEIQFTRVNSGGRTDTRVNSSGRMNTNVKSVNSEPQAEIVFEIFPKGDPRVDKPPSSELNKGVRVKREPVDSEPRAEIEFMPVKEEPLDDEFEPIAPLSDEQIRLIMGMEEEAEKQAGENLNTASNTSTKSITSNVAVNTGSQQATQSLGTSRRVPNILKPAPVPTPVAQMSTSPLPVAQVQNVAVVSPQTGQVKVRSIVAPQNVLNQVMPQVMQQLTSEPDPIQEQSVVPRGRGSRNRLPSPAPDKNASTKRFTKKIQSKNTKKSEDLWKEYREKYGPSSRRAANTSFFRGQRLIEMQSSFTGTVPRIVEVRSNNLSAYSGDALWEKIVGTPANSTNSSPSVSVDSGLKISNVRSERPLDAEQKWDNAFGKKVSTGKGTVSSHTKEKVAPRVEIKTEPGLEDTSEKVVPVNLIKASGQKSDSDSDNDGVLLRADDVSGDDDTPGGEDSNQTDSTNVPLNPSFGGFTNAQPITIHIPIAPKPQKKFFKSSRTTKTRFDKGKFVSSTIQTGASKFDVLPEKLPSEEEKPQSIKRGQRVNTDGKNSAYWKRQYKEKKREYSCSLPQGGEVIRKVGIIKEIKPPNAPSKYACHICGHSFKYSAEIRNHVKIHTEYHCDICKVDFPTKKIHREHVDTFHSYLSDRKETDTTAKSSSTKYDNLERYFSIVEGEDDGKKEEEMQWDKCYEENGLHGLRLKSEPTDPSAFDDGGSVHSSDSDVQDGDVFAPLCGVNDGPSDAEWAKIVAK